MRARPWVLAAALGAVAAVSACGSSPSARTIAPPATTAAQAPALKLSAIEVVTPRSGRTLEAHVRGNDLVATLELSGRAAPVQIVYTQAGCTQPACGQIASTDRHGDWQTRLVVVAPADAPELSVVVGYTDPASGQPPITLRVKLGRVAGAPVKHRRTHPSPAPVGVLPPIPGPTGQTTVVPPVTVTSSPVSGEVRPLVMIGDSLAQGTRDALAADLPGWSVVTNARVGRPLAEGMRILRQTPVTDPRTILAFSLFTNDVPTDVAALRNAVLTSVARLGAHGCAIWATIHRPPQGGVSYSAANVALVRMAAEPALAGRLLIVPWAKLVVGHPDWLAPDDVHGTQLGYEQRALRYAQAAQSCSA